MAKSKAYRAAAAKIEAGKYYSTDEAVAFVKETGSKKFDSTVEVALKLGVDPRKADQMVRGTVILPHGTGKTARVIVFATALAGLGVTVPVFGFGMRPRGPSTLPRRPTLPMSSGVETAESKAV